MCNPCRIPLFAASLCLIASARAAEPAPSVVGPDEIRHAVEQALPLLERASAGSADQRTCFTCHSQAMPVLTFVEAARRGFVPEPKNLERQVEHTYAHLKRGRKSFEEGKGIGGGIDTAGYALWTLEDAGRESDDLTGLVVTYILQKQNRDGYWKCSSDRPPSESSHFTTTYLALRAVHAFGDETHSEQIESAIEKAAAWLRATEPLDTEDRVFQLISSDYADLADEFRQQQMDALVAAQRDDDGWSQKPNMQSDAYASGSVLYALHRAGMATTDPVWQRGLRYLLDSQLDDGSWHVVTRSNPFQTYYESGFPHAKDQFISTTATSWATIALLLALPVQQPPTIETLADTAPLELPESDLSGRVMFAAHRFVEQEIERVGKTRHKLKVDRGTAEALRFELRKLLGVVDERLPPRLERYGDDENPALVAESDSFRVYQVRWPVFGNVEGEGLWVQQTGRVVGRCVVVPDADQSPEQLLGLVEGVDDHLQIAERLAAQGFELLIPAVVSRQKLTSADARLERADMTHREWIYRQAFHMGRHVIGYDIQRVLSAVDWFDSRNSEDTKIGVVGYGEGGLIALHAAAVDTRIDVSLVSGYFDASATSWSEPIYRNVWRRGRSHGNAEVASLIVPRELILEHSRFPEVANHKGDLTTPDAARVRAEFDLIRKSGADRAPSLHVGPDEQPSEPWSVAAVDDFVSRFSAEQKGASPAGALTDLRAGAAELIAARQLRCMKQLEEHVQSLVTRSEHVRDDAFLYDIMPEFSQRAWSTQRRHALLAPDKFIEASKAFRERFHADAMGRFDAPLLPPNARTRKVAETELWTAYDVLLDVYDGLPAWGVLVIPKDLRPDERRPVVVCQHGRDGVPRDTIDANKSAYNNFAAKLAERGFITFAPHNLYRGEDDYRWLDRKANTLGCSLFSFIIGSHDQTLRWLESLPFVDSQRIAFYGLSYGGETAVRVPTILEKYCLSICSGDFNQWTRKVAATDQPFSFMNTIEWEMPYWNLGNTFDYAEMTYLMFPRPFMVERGHHDGVGRDQWVAHEFAKVRWLYAQFGLTDRLSIEFFQGGHSIHGEGTFDFLHQHLDWPKR